VLIHILDNHSGIFNIKVKSFFTPHSCSGVIKLSMLIIDV
jgi:hypothetical protein